MSDNIKIVMEIPRNEYEQTCNLTLHDRTMWDDAIRNGIPLDDVKAEINDIPTVDFFETYRVKTKIFEILDNIGKAESEDKE